MKKSMKQKVWKSFLDELFVIPSYDYDKLTQFIEFRECSKGETLGNSCPTPNHLYFILNGGLGLMREGKLERVYFPKQVAMDVNSFKDASKSPYCLVALQKSSLVSLNIANETKIWDEIPSFKAISQKIWEMTEKSEKEWVKLSQMHYHHPIPVVRSL